MKLIINSLENTPYLLIFALTLLFLIAKHADN
ncbi:hypothetical protein LYNGBM3L_40710 [Moorena producens 3L]|uniref:Uncharacterized protein n=1 Tax=Moorena producens 3L TaxID=489825 RepID=F4XVI3_9CYAN|nr:hypothetical protein LYNGBM3L_40710 [Moorena producens 3L]